MHLVPGARVERYVVEAKIGAGTTTTTWRARHASLDTLHALCVPNEGNPALLNARLVAGARIQARLRHPHVVAATDVLDLGGTPAIVLDHVDGPTLEEFVHAHELDEGSIDAIAAGLFEGVGWLHRNGVVHRNLKLRNVIVDLASDAYIPRVTDFMLAKVLGERAGRGRGPRVFGTPTFMAPEQTIDSNQVDHRADLWSLGCILYHLCTGRPAFDAVEPEQVFQLVRAGRYAPLRQLVPSAPRRWGYAIDAALVVDPEQRAPSAEALAERWFAGATERPRRARRTAPVGQIALVFTDVQGSTGLWEARPELARHNLRAHDAILRAELHRHGGYEVKTEGDAFMIAFPDAVHATRFCLDAQRALHQHPWSPELLALPEAEDAPGFRGLRVRMGVHVGEPEARASGDRVDYFGPMVNRAARVSGAGHGGQILLSAEAWEQARPAIVGEVHAELLGAFQLRGLDGLQELVQVLPTELADRRFPAVRATPGTPAPILAR